MATASHLVVISHGQWGTPTDVKNLGNSIAEAGGDAVTVLLPNDNKFLRTYDGIDVCGGRLAGAIRTAIEAGQYSNISLIGYSAGGLYMRYAVGLLHAEDYFQKKGIKCDAFVTMATPHLGVRHSYRSQVGRARNGVITMLGNLYGGRSLDQMMLEDGIETGKENSCLPLLLRMSLPGSSFFEGLRQFKRLYVYANAFNDHSVNYSSAAIARRNIYRTRRQSSIEHIDGHTYITNIIPLSIAAAAERELELQLETQGVITPPPDGPHPLKMALIGAILLPIVLVHALILITPIRLTAALTEPKDPEKPLVNIVEGEYNGEGNLEPDAVPRLIRGYLSTEELNLHRVDVCLPSLNAHGTIVSRRSFNVSAGSHVVRHLISVLLGSASPPTSPVKVGDNNDEEATIVNVTIGLSPERPIE